MGKKLTDKQERFCREYMIDLNATQAAIRAGYKEASAKEQGYENLTKPHIESRIKELQKKKAKELDITFNDVLYVFWSIAQKASARDSDKIKGAEDTAKMLGFFEEHNKQKKSQTRKRINWKEGIIDIEEV